MRLISKVQILPKKCKSCELVNELSELDPVLLGQALHVDESYYIILLKVKPSFLGYSEAVSILLLEFHG